ncbi:MAG: protein TolR [Chitinivibrionales bacterium]|nr:protein TolR [Chitinivibrionales bacterium]
MARNRKRKRTRKLISELNITNLVDVTFAVLIIFMITAPMMTQGVQVDLPEAQAENVEANEYIQISVNTRNEIYINQERTTLLAFRKRFREVFANRQEVPVFLNADKKVPYGIAIRVISELQSEGVVKLGFLTTPFSKSGKPR